MNRICKPLRIWILVVFAVVVAVFQPYPCEGAETSSVAFLRRLLEREDLSKEERVAELQTHIKKLSKAEFQKFLKEVSATEKVFRGEEDRAMSMFFYARWYLDGPGKNDDLLANLALVKDQSLPWEWRWALLDILKPEEQEQLSAEALSTILAGFRETATDQETPDELRYSVMEKTGSLLLTQIELMEVKVPDAKALIANHDEEILQSKQVAQDPRTFEMAKALLREVARFGQDLDALALGAAQSQHFRRRIADLRDEWHARISKGEDKE
ncbi:MAG: hypothetical protein GX595_10005 [Lentisphaerae bacterium]|nr:hypothetical protein [Lentisphaerota bacterium]